MFKDLKNLSALMSQGPAIKEKIERFNQDMQAKRIHTEAGAGAVEITMNGKCEVQSLKIDPHMLRALVSDEGPADADLEMIEELLKSAFNAGQAKVHAEVQDELKKAAGGLNIPGLENMM